jgi:hypothetical protein
MTLLTSFYFPCIFVPSARALHFFRDPLSVVPGAHFRFSKQQSAGAAPLSSRIPPLSPSPSCISLHHLALPSCIHGHSLVPKCSLAAARITPPRRPSRSRYLRASRPLRCKMHFQNAWAMGCIVVKYHECKALFQRHYDIYSRHAHHNGARCRAQGTALQKLHKRCLRRCAQVQM